MTTKSHVQTINTVYIVLLKVVVNALFAAIPGIANVLVVSLLFWLIFSILGVHFFAGKFYKCVNEDNSQLPASVIASKAECMNRTIDGYRWINSNVNFDNVLAGFLALMQVVRYHLFFFFFFLFFLALTSD